MPGLTVKQAPSAAFDSNYWLTTILLDDGLRVKGQDRAYTAATRSPYAPNDNVEAMRLALAEEQIESRPLWNPLHLHPAFAACPAYTNGVSEHLYRRGLCLPSGPMVSDDDADRIVAAIRRCIE